MLMAKASLLVQQGFLAWPGRDHLYEVVMPVSNLSNGADREKSPPPNLPPHGEWGPPDLLAARVAALLKHDLAHCLRDEVAGLFKDLVAEHSELKEVNNSIEDVWPVAARGKVR